MAKHLPNKAQRSNQSNNAADGNGAAKNRGGRPSVISKDIIARLLDAIAHGASIEAAAQRAGIAPRTVYRWLHKGMNDSEPGSIHRSLVGLVREAQDARYVQCHRLLGTAVDEGNLSVAKWYISNRERIQPDALSYEPVTTAIDPTMPELSFRPDDPIDLPEDLDLSSLFGRFKAPL